jgi:hypothetical protein
MNLHPHAVRQLLWTWYPAATLHRFSRFHDVYTTNYAMELQNVNMEYY